MISYSWSGTYNIDRVALNSQSVIYLCLSRAGIKDVHQHAWLES